MSNPETKTIPPKTTETQNPFTSFDPMTAWTTAQQTFHKMFADAQTRAQAFAEEYAALEKQMFARAQANVASFAQLAQDAIAYSQNLAEQARKLGLEAARKMSPGA
jgi:hypothetical protein